MHIAELLHVVAREVLFEDHRSTWVFQKPLHTSIVLNGDNAMNIILQVINDEEKSE